MYSSKKGTNEARSLTFSAKKTPIGLHEAIRGGAMWNVGQMFSVASNNFVHMRPIDCGYYLSFVHYQTRLAYF